MRSKAHSVLNRALNDIDSLFLAWIKITVGLASSGGGVEILILFSVDVAFNVTPSISINAISVHLENSTLDQIREFLVYVDTYDDSLLMH